MKKYFGSPKQKTRMSYCHMSKIKSQVRCVPRAQVCAVLLCVYLFAYCLNLYNKMHFTWFRQLSLNAALRK